MFFILSILGGALVGFFIGMPLIVIGSILTFSTSDLLFRICWLLYALFFPLLALFGNNYVRFDISSRVTLGCLVAFLPLLVWTVVKARRGTLNSGSRKVILLSVLLFLLMTALFRFLTGLF